MPTALVETLGQALAAAGPAGLEARCRAELSLRRVMDAMAVEHLMERELAPFLLRALEGPEALAQLARALATLAASSACLGCATCCRRGSPSLHAPDLELITSGALPRAALYTLRRGERASLDRLGRVVYLETELIKLREQPGLGCLFLRECRCGLYQQRPLQCRHLECWSQRHAGQLAEARLTRRDLYAQDARALALMAEYDQRLPGRGLAQALEQAAAGKGQQEALELLELDHRLRAGIAAHYGYGREEQELLLGRPARKVALAHGLELALDQGGRPVLIPPSSA